ncbi:MAG TPA: methylated-DNA--[protein]-cysteine S-methyltransferase [Steroidobacteraceae bacterium]|nr:methylated-DNA--[protein]-cysteine S-methyltransferase [Steroidobacteraceae bacterium]
MIYWHETDTPIGPLLLAGTAEALTRVNFQAGPRPLEPPAQWQHDAAPFAPALTQLREYFSGSRRTFTLPLSPVGTPFQLLVWKGLLSIPYGQTISYGELAQRLGLTSGARAVGLANGANPLPVIVPCHRVIGADGSLTGFGGGLDIKRELLALEGAACVADLFSETQPGTLSAGERSSSAPQPSAGPTDELGGLRARAP